MATAPSPPATPSAATRGWGGRAGGGPWAGASPERRWVVQLVTVVVMMVMMMVMQVETILDTHNQLRARRARGEEARGSPGPQPPAADMRKMVPRKMIVMMMMMTMTMPGVG